MSASSLQLIHSMERNIIQPLTVASKAKPKPRKVIDSSEDDDDDDYEEDEEEEEKDEEENAVTVQSTKYGLKLLSIQAFRVQSQRG